MTLTDVLWSSASFLTPNDSEGPSPLDVDVLVIPECLSLDKARIGEIEDLTRFVLRTTGSRGSWSVAIVLTDDGRLRALHRDFMGIDEDTDVMTFPDEPGLSEADRGGNIIISVDRAREQADDEGHGLLDEVMFLVVHGLLHLQGWDDSDDEARTQMLAKQERLLSEFARRNG